MLAAHRNIRAEPACAQDHCLSRAQEGLLAAGFDPDALDRALQVVAPHDAGHGRLQADRNVALVALRLQRADDRAAAPVVGRLVAARPQRADAGVDGGRELDALLLQPVYCVERVVHQVSHLFGVGLKITALQRMLEMQVRGILDVLLLLQFRIGGIEQGARRDGVAAERASLFDENHLRSGIVCLDRRTEARIAGADDHDVGLLVPLPGRRDRLELLRIERARRCRARTDHGRALEEAALGDQILLVFFHHLLLSSTPAVLITACDTPARICGALSNGLWGRGTGLGCPRTAGGRRETSQRKDAGKPRRTRLERPQRGRYCADFQTRQRRRWGK